MKLGIFFSDFRKILKHQISWQSVQWESSCSMRTDRHDEPNSRFSKFCNRTYKCATLVSVHFVNIIQYFPLATEAGISLTFRRRNFLLNFSTPCI